MSESHDPKRATVSTSCHIIPFDPGLYSLELAPGTQDRGMGLPAARVSLPPGAQYEVRTVSISAFRADGWLGATDKPTLIRVLDARSPVMVTLYWHAADGPAAVPGLHLVRLNMDQGILAGHPAGHAPAPPPAPTPAPMPQAERAAGMSADSEVIAHIENIGDVEGRIGDWVGTRGGGRAIQGFSLTPRLGLMPEDLEYRAVISRERLSPWLPGGRFCGSRGLDLPLLGFCLRLRGPAAARYELACFARFVDGTEIGPIQADRVCAAETLAPLEAFQILVRPRGL